MTSYSVVTCSDVTGGTILLIIGNYEVELLIIACIQKLNIFLFHSSDLTA